VSSVATSLRSFRAGDADAVVALSRQAFARPEEHVGNPGWLSVAELEREIADWQPPPSETLVVAEEDAAVVGFGGVEIAEGFEHADLFGPVVAKHAQGRRLGTRLLEESVARARAHGASILVAAIGTRNARGRVLLERSGFVARSRPQAFYELRPEEHRPVVEAPESRPEVRRATRGDLDAVLALYRECFPADRFPEEALRSGLDGGTVYLAEIEGRPAGILTIDPADSWIYLVGVTAGERGRGIGGVLMSLSLEDYWKEHPGEALGLSVRADNDPAVRLYRRQGFRPTILLQVYELAL
jgi:[ribosomal protein S18]-alanine N-acetyltransferase